MAIGRRERILILFRTRDAFLPEPVRRVETPSGFDHEPRDRDCPDCIANGRVMKTCETCGGSGRVHPDRVAAIAAPDSRADDGGRGDAYQKNEPRPYGLTGEHNDRRVALDAAIQRAETELRRFPAFRPQTETDVIAGTQKYRWEREREKLYEQGSYAELNAALEKLHRLLPDAYHLLHVVDLHDRLTEADTERQLGGSVDGVVQVEPTIQMRRVADLALLFIDRLMPDPIRVPLRFQPDAARGYVHRRRRAA